MSRDGRKLNPESVRQELERNSRDPMLDVLANVLAGAPTLEEIRSLAKEAPDRWALLLEKVHRRAYGDKIKVDVHHHLSLEDAFADLVKSNGVDKAREIGNAYGWPVAELEKTIRLPAPVEAEGDEGGVVIEHDDGEDDEYAGYGQN